MRENCVDECPKCLYGKKIREVWVDKVSWDEFVKENKKLCGCDCHFGVEDVGKQFGDILVVGTYKDPYAKRGFGFEKRIVNAA